MTEKDFYRLSLKHKEILENEFNLICIQIEFDFIGADKVIGPESASRLNLNLTIPCEIDLGKHAL